MPRCSLSICLVILMWACSMSLGKRYPVGFLDDTCMLTMTRTCLGPKSSSMRFGYSYFTGHEIFNLWFVKHMLHNCTRISLNHSRCLWHAHAGIQLWTRLVLVATCGMVTSLHFSPDKEYISISRRYQLHPVFATTNCPSDNTDTYGLKKKNHKKEKSHYSD
jgi:hypothetical protein